MIGLGIIPVLVNVILLPVGVVALRRSGEGKEIDMGESSDSESRGGSRALRRWVWQLVMAGLIVAAVWFLAMLCVRKFGPTI